MFCGSDSSVSRCFTKPEEPFLYVDGVEPVTHTFLSREPEPHRHVAYTVEWVYYLKEFTETSNTLRDGETSLQHPRPHEHPCGLF
jgi:hypothetical protein